MVARLLELYRLERPRFILTVMFVGSFAYGWWVLRSVPPKFSTPVPPEVLHFVIAHMFGVGSVAGLLWIDHPDSRSRTWRILRRGSAIVLVVLSATVYLLFFPSPFG